MAYDYFKRLFGQGLEDPGTGDTAFNPGPASAPQSAPALGMIDPNQTDPGNIAAAPGLAVGATNAGSGNHGRSVAGSTFVNFGDLYRANAQKSQAMARRLTGKAEQQGQQASSDIGSAEGTADAAISAGTNTYQPGTYTLPPPQATGTRTTTNGAGLQSESTKTPGATPPPAAPGAITAGELAARANRGYSGPASMADQMGADAYANLGTEAQKAQSYATGLNTGEGVQSALGYTGSTGVSREDAALAQGAGSGAFGTLAKRYGGLMQSLQDAQDRTTGRATDAAGESADAQKLYQADLDAYSQLEGAGGSGGGAPLPGVSVGFNNPLNSAQGGGVFDNLSTGKNVQLKDIQGDLDKYAPGIADGASQYGVDEATVRETLQNMTYQQYQQWEADPAGFWSAIAKQKGGK